MSESDADYLRQLYACILEDEVQCGGKTAMVETWVCIEGSERSGKRYLLENDTHYRYEAAGKIDFWFKVRMGEELILDHWASRSEGRCGCDQCGDGKPMDVREAIHAHDQMVNALRQFFAALSLDDYD